MSDLLPFDLHAVTSEFASVDMRLVAIALVLQLVNVALRSRAWQNTLRGAYPDTHVPLGRVACAYTAGMALNGVVPGRGGDAAKAGFARLAIAGSAFTTVAGTLLVTGIFDAAAGILTLVVALATGRAPGLGGLSGHPVLLLTVAPLAITLAVVAGRRYRARLSNLRAGLLRGGEILRTPRRYLRSVVLLQALAWTSRLAVVFVLLRAFGIGAGVTEALLVLVVGGLAAAVPAPGGGGAQQIALVYLLAGEATTTQALSFSIGMQVGVTLLNTALGAIAIMVIFRTIRPLAALRAGRASLATARETAST